MHRQQMIEHLTEGMTVFGADGAKLGAIVLVDPAAAYVVVEKGFFFPTDYFIPLPAISRVDADGVWLMATKDAALEQGWDVPPAGPVEDAVVVEPTAAAGGEMGNAGAPGAVDPGRAWPPTSDAGYDALVGKDVASADDHKIGIIRVVQHPAVERPGAGGQHVLLLEPSLFNDWFAGFDPVFLPATAIASVEPERVVLNLTAEQIQQRSQTWTQPPAGFDGSAWTSANAPIEAAEPALRTRLDPP